VSEVPYKPITQRVYEYIAVCAREVAAREVVAALGDVTPSSVTFALTRLVRESQLTRTGHGRYCVSSGGATPAGDDDMLADPVLARIFEAIRPVLSFQDLALLYEVVAAARRLAPGLFERARRRSG
jgi:predicted transcriptional regulator of viral defense system